MNIFIVIFAQLLVAPASPAPGEAQVAAIADQSTDEATERMRLTDEFMSAVMAFFEPAFATLGEERGYPGDFEIYPSGSGTAAAAASIRGEFQRCMRSGILNLMGISMRAASSDLNLKDLRTLILFFRTPEAAHLYKLLERSQRKQLKAAEQAELERHGASGPMRRLLRSFNKVDAREGAEASIRACVDARTVRLEREGFEPHDR